MLRIHITSIVECLLDLKDPWLGSGEVGRVYLGPCSVRASVIGKLFHVDTHVGASPRDVVGLFLHGRSHVHQVVRSLHRVWRHNGIHGLSSCLGRIALIDDCL